jgi:hypothetical protein
MAAIVGQPPTSFKFLPPGNSARPPVSLAYFATTVKCVACAAMKLR